MKQQEQEIKAAVQAAKTQQKTMVVFKTKNDMYLYYDLTFAVKQKMADDISPIVLVNPAGVILGENSFETNFVLLTWKLFLEILPKMKSIDENITLDEVMGVTLKIVQGLNDGKTHSKLIVPNKGELDIIIAKIGDNVKPDCAKGCQIPKSLIEQDIDLSKKSKDAKNRYGDKYVLVEREIMGYCSLLAFMAEKGKTDDSEFRVLLSAVGGYATQFLDKAFLAEFKQKYDKYFEGKGDTNGNSK